jgi:hypothetical protein
MSFNVRYLHLQYMVSVCLNIEKFDYYYLYPAIAQAARCMGNIQLALICNKIADQAKHQMHILSKLHSCISQSLENVDCFMLYSHSPIYLYKQTQISTQQFEQINKVLFSNIINLLIFQCILHIVKLEGLEFSSTDNKSSIWKFNHHTKIQTNNVFFDETQYLALHSVLAYKQWKSMVFYFLLAKLSYCLGYNEIAQTFIRMSNKEQRTSFLLNQITTQTRPDKSIHEF